MPEVADVYGTVGPQGAVSVRGRIPPGKDRESPFTTPEIVEIGFDDGLTPITTDYESGGRWVWIGWMYFAYGAGIVTGVIVGIGIGVWLA